MLEFLAENNFGDTRSGSLAGPTGLVIILLLVIGTVLLIRNMNARLRRLPERFENQAQFEPRSRADSVRSPDALAGGAPSEPREDPAEQTDTTVDPKD
jgi:hypothetical protein